jgi:hypothetical protein
MDAIPPDQVQEAKDYCRLRDDKLGLIIKKTDEGM